MENKQQYEVWDNTGTLWMEVQEKQGKEGPYFVRTGSAKIDGREYWVNAYEKKTKTGKLLLSLTFKSKNLTESPKEDAPF